MESGGEEAVAVVAWGFESMVEIFKKKKGNGSELRAEQLKSSLTFGFYLIRKL